MERERLDKAVAGRTGFSRREVKALVREGRILLNGVPAVSPEQKIGADDGVMLDGRVLNLQKYIYIMLNKPGGVLSATRDRTEPTVMSLIPAELLRTGLFPAGRLDKDTKGFMLITDDGAFAHRVLSPKSHVPKTYRARLDKAADMQYLKSEFAKGMDLGGGDVASPAGVEMLEGGDTPLLELVIHEGAYHQVKRMFGRYSLTVVELERVRIGGLWLDRRLAPGECREISLGELSQIC